MADVDVHVHARAQDQRPVAFVTHYNFSRPFKVVITGDLVQVFKAVVARQMRADTVVNEMDNLTIVAEENVDGLRAPPDGDLIQFSMNRFFGQVTFNERPWFELKSGEIFIGKSPRCSITESANSFGPQFDGNTILLRCGSGESGAPRYCHIGGEISTFEIRGSRIAEFVSPVDCNDVPCSYAIDDLGNTYLVDQRVCLLEKFQWRLAADDPVTAYDNRPLIADVRVDETGALVRGTLSGRNPFGIEAIRQGGSPCALCYDPFPEELVFALYTAHLGPIMVEGPKGHIRQLAMQEQLDVMRDYAELLGIKPLVVKAGDPPG